jgi:dolichol-phosphate mannosyltransferase
MSEPKASVFGDRSAAAKTVVVIPTYNEAGNIAELVQRMFENLSGIHILVVDDRSPDQTAELVEKLTETYPNLRVLRRDGDRGLGHALTAGILYGLDNQFEIIGTMDGDLSHDPKYLPSMLGLLRDNDVVIGSRYVRDGGTVNWPIHLTLLSWLANEFAAGLLQIPAHDITSGFRLYRRNTLEWIRTVRIKSSGYSFLCELLYRAYRRGARIGEYPIVFHDRTLGVSKLHRREIYLGAVNLLRLRFFES